VEKQVGLRVEPQVMAREKVENQVGPQVRVKS